MKKIYFILNTTIIYLTTSCEENKLNSFIENKEQFPIQVYGIWLNDSIGYSITEVKENNLWKRDLNIHYRDSIKNKINVLYKKQKKLHMETYNQTKEVDYKIIDINKVVIITEIIGQENFETVFSKTYHDTVFIEQNGNLIRKNNLGYH